MSKSWSALIVIGIVTLAAVMIWEIIQVNSGARSLVKNIIIQMSRDVLIPANIADHLKNSPEYITFQSTLNQVSEE